MWGSILRMTTNFTFVLRQQQSFRPYHSALCKGIGIKKILSLHGSTALPQPTQQQRAKRELTSSSRSSCCPRRVSQGRQILLASFVAYECIGFSSTFNWIVWCITATHKGAHSSVFLFHPSGPEHMCAVHRARVR